MSVEELDSIRTRNPTNRYKPLDMASTQQLDEQIRVLALMSAHFEAIDNLFIETSDSLFTYKPRQIVNRMRKLLVQTIGEIEKNLDEEQLEHLDLLSEYYEKVIVQADTELKRTMDELKEGEASTV